MNDLDTAFAALASYDRGSGRAALLPLDEAVMAALRDGATRQRLEQRLITQLKTGGSVVAREYLCAKLALIGSSRSVPALATLLADPQVYDAARNALQVIPGKTATKALRSALPRLPPVQQCGVIQSLAERRDTDSVSRLGKLLKEGREPVAEAAGAALGNIGSNKAGRALSQAYPRACGPLRGAIVDALLVCAEQLFRAGHAAEARALCSPLFGTDSPAHLRQAAERLRTRIK